MSATARRYRAVRRVALTTEIPDDAPARVKEGAARRRLVAATGRCPCGAAIPSVELVPGTVTVAAVYHEPTCPAADDVHPKPASHQRDEQ